MSQPIFVVIDELTDDGWDSNSENVLVTTSLDKAIMKYIQMDKTFSTIQIWADEKLIYEWGDNKEDERKDFNIIKHDIRNILKFGVDNINRSVVLRDKKRVLNITDFNL